MMLLVLIKTAQTSPPSRATQITVWLRMLRGNNQESRNRHLFATTLPVRAQVGARSAGATSEARGGFEKYGSANRS
jgi:hypothetical protein